MKHRPVVPDVVGARGAPPGDVLGDPVDLPGRRSDPRLGSLKGGGGNIQDGEVAPTGGEEGVHQG